MEWIKTIIESDRELFLFLNGFHNHFSDNFMYMISQMEIWSPLYAVIIAFIFKTYKRKGFLILSFFIILILLSGLFSNAVKETVQRLRPFNDPLIKNLAHTVINNAGLYGFVSGHATNVFAGFTFTTLIFRNRWYTCTLLIWAILVSYSRIYLGVHFPLDILGGIVSGCFTGWLVFKSVILVDKHFFFERHPKIGETRLQNNSALIFAAVYFFTIIILFIVIRSLNHASLL
jgi:undecaprenyl-diphosphatase